MKCYFFLHGVVIMALTNSNSVSGTRTYTKTDLIDFIAGSTLLAAGGGGVEQIAPNMPDDSGITSVKTVTVDNIENTIPPAMNPGGDFTSSYIPIGAPPKLTPQVATRKGSGKQKNKISLHIRQSDEETFHLLHNGQPCRSPQCSLDHHKMLGSRLTFTSRRPNEFSKILTFRWLEIA